jgi:hypothetical protein
MICDADTTLHYLGKFQKELSAIDTYIASMESAAESTFHRDLIDKVDRIMSSFENESLYELPLVSAEDAFFLTRVVTAYSAEKKLIDELGKQPPSVPTAPPYPAVTLLLQELQKEIIPQETCFETYSPGPSQEDFSTTIPKKRKRIIDPEDDAFYAPKRRKTNDCPLSEDVEMVEREDSQSEPSTPCSDEETSHVRKDFAALALDSSNTFYQGSA